MIRACSQGSQANGTASLEIQGVSILARPATIRKHLGQPQPLAELLGFGGASKLQLLHPASLPSAPIARIKARRLQSPFPSNCSEGENRRAPRPLFPRDGAPGSDTTRSARRPSTQPTFTDPSPASSRLLLLLSLRAARLPRLLLKALVMPQSYVTPGGGEARRSQPARRGGASYSPSHSRPTQPGLLPQSGRLDGAWRERLVCLRPGSRERGSPPRAPGSMLLLATRRAVDVCPSAQG